MGAGQTERLSGMHHRHTLGKNRQPSAISEKEQSTESRAIADNRRFPAWETPDASGRSVNKEPDGFCLDLLAQSFLCTNLLKISILTFGNQAEASRCLPLWGFN
jgi:hypothetical protein